MIVPDRIARVGDVAVETLARAYGTPLLAIDLAVLDAAIARFEHASRRYGIEVAYAGKALLPVALVKRLARSSLDLDVCSFGELVVAERGGMPPDRIILHGCGKRRDEILAAVAGRAGRIVVDHMPELTTLAAAAMPARPVRVLLRLNSGIAAETHAAVNTSGDGTKFGFSHDEFPEAATFLRAQKALRFAGIHTHLGSQIFDEDVYVRALDVLLDALAKTARRRTDEPAMLVIGGGFGVDAHPGGIPFDLESLLGKIGERARTGAAQRGIPVPRIGIEPGRAIIADAGTSIYEVVAVKQLGGRRFVIVDGSLTDNPRPALYGAYHHPSAITGRPQETFVDTTLCGRACENDELVTAPLPEDLAPGDFVTLNSAGAYAFPMASNYNRFNRPPLIFVDRERHGAVVRRETVDDLLRCELEWP